ncbi:MAG: hypothetical protein KF764_11310 [Labilithrix sp.]|nr:hypothetical protein [Labilithrix sp.]
MAEIPWARHTKPVKASTFRPMLVLLASTFFDAMKSPEQAAFLVQRCAEKIQQDLKTRHREEEDASDDNALKWAWWRLLWDGRNLRVLRNAIYEQTASQPAPLGTALQDLAQVAQTVIDELVAANEKAPQLNPRKQDEDLPNMDLPEAPRAPKNVDYGGLIDGNGGDR